MSVAKNILNLMLGTNPDEVKKEIEQLENVKLDSATLEDGTVIETEGAFEVGAAVFVPVEDGESIPVPAGQYALDNGFTIAVDENGVITNMTETSELEAQKENEETEMKNKPETVEQQAKKQIERQVQEKETIFSKADVEKQIAEKLEAFEAKFSKQVDAQNSEIDMLKAELKAEREKNEELETKLQAEPIAKPISRAPQKAEHKFSLPKGKPQNLTEKILMKTQNLKSE